MAITERLALLVTMDAQGAIKGFNDLGKAADKNLSKSDARLDKLASRFQKAGAGMLAGAGLAAAGLFKAGQAAGDLEQALGGTEAVFGDASAVIDDFAKKAAQAAGLSETAFRTATTSIGGQLKGLGFSVDEAAGKAVDLTQVAADLAATYGGTTADAVASLGAALRGEADPAERFNLFLNQARVNAKAVELGLAKTTSTVSAHAKAQATLALVTEQSADAQGQFGREADTAQGAMARFSAESENLKATLGSAVVPILAGVADRVGGLVESFNNLPQAQQNAISKFAVMGTAALGTAGALSFTVGKAIDMRKNLSKLSPLFVSSAGGLTKLGAAGSVAGVALGALAIKSIGDELSKTIVDIDGFSASLANMTEESEKQQKQQISALASIGKLDEVVSQLAKGNGVAATTFIDLAESTGIGADKIAEYRQEVEDNRRVQAQSKIDQDKNTKAIDETVEALGGYEGAAGGAAEGADAVTSAVERQKEALDKAKTSIDLFKQGMEDAFKPLDIEDTTDKRASALKDISDRFADANEAVTAARQRVQDLLNTKPEDRSSSYQADIIAAQKDVQEALDDTSRSLEGNSEAALANREDLRGVVDDIGGIIQAHRDEGASLEELQFIRAMERENLRQQLEQLGFNKDEIGKYIEAIDAIPITAATTITVDVAEAEAKIQGFLKTLESVPGSIDAAIADRNLQRFTASNADTLAGRAIGGPVTGGQGYRVNEYLGAGKGQEWFAPANGTVMPASPTSGAVSQSIQIQINNPTPEPANTSIRKLRSEMAMAGV